MLGPPGIGKGTNAEKLSSKLKFPHIATGEMLRQNVAKKTKLGLEAKSYMDQGKLVPDQVVIDMVKERLQEIDCSKGFILDGFPRTINQADEINEVKIDKILNMQADDKVIVDRINC